MSHISTKNLINISSIEEILNEARQGRLFIVMDNENRENEGDLVIPASKVTCDAVNMMIRYGSGIVCLCITDSQRKKLNLRLMDRNNVGDEYTAFTTSIDALKGITTGVSAEDRKHTILTAISEGSTEKDLVTPGHIFPIVAKNGGVLERPGHTEASIEIVRLAGLFPAAVICELMRPDGKMSRLPDVMQFASDHQLKITTIEKLIDYLKS